MPMPKPRQGESRSEFVSRCVSDDNIQNESSDNDQAVAICSSIWDERSMNDSLLERIRTRQQKKTEFGYGILTADKHVANLQDWAGLDCCYKYASRGNQSFNDLMQKAKETLVYSNEDMRVKDVAESNASKFRQYCKDHLNADIEIPKNTLMVFRHTLTTTRKDRDGDVLRTDGAEVDPKLLMLWQHIHTLPVGKMLGIAEHIAAKLSLVSSIVDVNEICHDSAVMIDNDMARFSHGFRALEFEDLKEEEGEITSPGGFDVKRFEIMEASIVSVPSNVDAEVEEVILSLVEGGKLTSGIMKEVGKTIRNHRSIQLPVGIDLRLTVNGEEVKNANESRSREKEAEEKGESDCTPEKADENKTKETEEAAGSQVDEQKQEQDEVIDSVEDGKEDKAGSVLSKRNLKALMDVRDDLSELKDMDMARGGHALCERCIKKLEGVIESAGGSDDDDEYKEPDAKSAMAKFIIESTDKQKQEMFSILAVMNGQNKSKRLIEQYRSFVRTS